MEVAFGVEVLFLVGDGSSLLLDTPALVVVDMLGIGQGSHCSQNDEEYLEVYQCNDEKPGILTSLALHPLRFLAAYREGLLPIPHG